MLEELIASEYLKQIFEGTDTSFEETGELVTLSRIPHTNEEVIELAECIFDEL